MSTVTTQLPAALEAVFDSYQSTDAKLGALMPVLCQVLQCDRTSLYLRNPHTQIGTITHCYRRDPIWNDMTSPDWESEGNVAEIDPLFAAALKTTEPVVVDDIETADPTVVNTEFEKRDFQHRALIHAPLYHNGLMFGILEPCVFDRPRPWSEGDCQIIALVQTRLSPIVVQYLQEHGWY